MLLSVLNIILFIIFDVLKPTFKILLTIFLFSELLFAQFQKDSLEFSVNIPVNKLVSKFDKQLNTYLLNSAVFYSRLLGKINITFSENYTSTLIRTFKNSTRDEHNFNLITSYGLDDNIKMGMKITNNILSDNRSIQINKASFTNLIFFTRYNPSEEYSISPFLGYSNNNQVNQTDVGTVYGIEGKFDRENRELIIGSQLKFKNEDISPRKNSLQYLGFNISNQLEGNIANNFNSYYSRNRRDFYFEADSLISSTFNVANNIQSRTETGYFLNDELNYDNFLDLFLLKVEGRLLFRRIDRDTRYRPIEVLSSSVFDTKIDELTFNLGSSIYYQSNNFNGRLKVQFTQRDEKHIAKSFKGANAFLLEERSKLEAQKNNNSARFSVSIDGVFHASKTDLFSFSLFQNKLRYDTPSNLNFDDRDELLSIVKIEYTKKLTPFFDAFVFLEGSLNQTVYIYGEKSSNNNINRVIKLTAGGNYKGKFFRTSNSFGVSANYTVYDFEDLTPNFRSFSFRQFTATDSTFIKLNRNINFSHYGYLKLSEQGDFNWAKFSTKPTRFLEEIFSESKIILNINNISLATGLRIFSLNTFNYKIRDKIIDSKYFSIGPLSEIVIFRNNLLNLRLYGWYEFISLTSDNKQQANLMMDMSWNF